MIDKLLTKARQSVIDKAESTIKKLIKEKRLVYLSAEKVEYTNKQGEKRELTLSEMASLIIDSTGMRQHFASIGLGDENIKILLYEQYEKGSQK